MRGKYSARLAMPPSFGFPPAIQKMSEKDDSARAAASALVPLESLTNSTWPRRPTCSMRCARPGKLRRPFCRTSRPTPSASAQATQRADAADPRDFAARAAGRAQDGFMLDIDAIGERIPHGYAHHTRARLLDAVGGVATMDVVDADDRRPLRH